MSLLLSCLVVVVIVFVFAVFAVVVIVFADVFIVVVVFAVVVFTVVVFDDDDNDKTDEGCLGGRGIWRRNMRKPRWEADCLQ